MNLHTERIRGNNSEPSGGTSIIVCSSNRYCQRSTQPVGSDKLWFGAYHFRQYYRPEAIQVVLAESTHENPYTKIDLGLNNWSRRVLQNVDQFFLDRWKRCQKLVLLAAEQDIRHSPHVH